jgi:hypothetical protein
VPRKIRQWFQTSSGQGSILCPGAKARIESFDTQNFPARSFSAAKRATTRHYQEKQIRNAIREASK